MKAIVKFIIFILRIYHNHGWIGLYSLVGRVTWKQDCNLINNGHDILSWGNNHDGYFYGTYWEVRRIWE